MADLKISALPASTTPLAGTEVLPIVQSSTTKQVSVANLTDGRAISAIQLTLTTGNLIVANGQGVDFSATPNTGTSELFNDYEEGTWTPNQGSGVTVTGTFSSQGRYTKIGRVVYVYGRLTATGNILLNASGELTTNLPFTSADLSTCVITNGSPNASSGALVGSTTVTGTTAITVTSNLFFSAVYSV